MFTSLLLSICYFLPPTGWEIAQLKKPSPHVQVGFVGKGDRDYQPSINLAFEEVDVPLKEYIKSVKQVHLSANPNLKWRDLGKFSTQAGEGRLLEMSQLSAFGEVKILQAIVVQDQKAYILTSATLKEDFSKYQTDIIASFRSLALIPELWSPISDPKKRVVLQDLFAKLGSGREKWDEFQKEIGSLTQLGPHWQFLALKEAREKLEN